MKKTLLSLCALAAAVLAVAGIPEVVRTISTKPQVKQPVVELKKASRVALPARVKKASGSL
ncbi:MAG: hypothetical protein IJ775_04625, partial [Muribaculaceae bacterium]|nr:hypothetical protein [Muribaculaceae bacterium]